MTLDWQFSDGPNPFRQRDPKSDAAISMLAALNEMRTRIIREDRLPNADDMRVIVSAIAQAEAAGIKTEE